MPLTQSQRNMIIERLKANKRQYEISKELGVSKSSVQHYSKQLKILNTQKESDVYFNVDVYFKNTPTI
jgi:DNA-directed RNA polymerase specialized sigma subunit